LEVLSTPAAIQKAEREIAEYRRFQQWSRAFLEVNTKICRQRPTEGELAGAQKKKRPQRFGRRSLGR
jgi:hypothetical protein